MTLLTPSNRESWSSDGRERHDASDLTSLDLSEAFKDLSADITDGFLSHFNLLPIWKSGDLATRSDHERDTGSSMTEHLNQAVDTKAVDLPTK
jgi:hypothetical protein